jgi:hypothetical protein
MITVKILCVCGQKYAFDVEPYNGRMPSSVQCPICKADGTAAANEILARTLPPPPIAAAVAQPAAPIQYMAPPPTAGSLRIASGAQAAHAEAPATAAPAPPRAATPGGMSTAQRQKLQAELKKGAGGDSDNWKWWYYILAGVGFAGYDIWLAYDQQRLKPLGGLFLSFVLICIGIWDFNRKRQIKRQLRGR